MGAGGNIGEASDNPVEINVTAMVDVIFCLCIFFMCSFHFKQLEGKIDTWLPQDKGFGHETIIKPVLEEIRVFMRWDAAAGVTTRKIGSRAAVGSDSDLMTIIQSMRTDYTNAGKLEVPILIDATPDVPWTDVVHLVDLCKTEKLSKIEFVEPIEYTGRSQSR
jgi:biopolymer transport protein ExbD